MTHSIQWQIRLFGTLRIEAHSSTDGGGSDLPGKAAPSELRNPAGKARSLLAYLLLYPGIRLTREQVMDALWQDLPLDRARRALSDTLYRLRETPIGALIESEGEEIALAAGTKLWVDVWEFARCARLDDPIAIDRALALAVAPLLPEVYDDWIIARRTALQDERIALLRKRATLAEDESDLTRANTLYQQIIEQDNLDEAAWRGRIRALARMGHPRDALDTYQRLEELLDDELGAPPETESSQLAAQIRREFDAQRASAPQNLAAIPVFVGRLRERSQLIAALDGAITGQGGMRIVLADAGMGRTALLQEIEQSARWRGVQVVWGNGTGDTLPQPYAPLRAALRTALPEARMQQLEAFVRAPWLAAVRQLLAESESTAAISSEECQPVAAQPANPVRTIEELALAVGSSLKALGQIVPHLILLDDMQWADRSLWQLLDGLRQSLAQSRVLLVLSGRHADLQEETSVRDRLTAWEQAGDIVVQHLGGLSESELGELLTHHRLLPSDPGALASIHRDSGGNPLHALMLAPATQGGRADPPRGDRDEIARAYLLRRVRALSVEARSALEVGAILGAQFTWQMWAGLWRALDQDAMQLPLIAGQLEQQEFVHLQGATYRFASTLLQGAIIAELDATRIVDLHRRAYVVLESLAGVPINERLRHAQMAGMRAETHRLALAAGKTAAASLAMHSARDFYSLALENVPEDNLRGRFELYIARARAEALLAQRAEQEADLQAARTLADLLDHDSLRIEAHDLTADYLLTTGNPDGALAAALQALALIERASANESPINVASEAHVHETLARIQRERKQLTEAIEQIERARALYEALGDGWGVAHTTDTRAGLAWDGGDYRRAAHDHLEAANRFAALGDILGEARALNNLGSTYWELGDYAGARTTHERAMVVCHDAGDLLGEGDNIDNLGGVYWSLGDYDTAIEHYSTALKMRRAIRDEWGVSISLGNLGSALLRQGNPQAALEYYEEAWPMYKAIGRRRSEGYVLHNIGCARLDLGDVPAALDALRTARAIRSEIGDQSKMIETEAMLALACLAANDAVAARASMDAALTALAAEEYPPALQQETHFAAYRICRQEQDIAAALEHLGKAELATAAISATLPTDAIAVFLANVPLNRHIGEAIVEHAMMTEAQIARIDAPRGRALRPEEQVTVRWSIATPGDALIADPAERRRRALRRLLDEATRQKGAPTDDDLAGALGVSRRTILRDIEALEAAGVNVATRFRN